MKEKFEEECGSEKKGKAIFHKKQKNTKKLEKRKATWADKRLKKKTSI